MANSLDRQLQAAMNMVPDCVAAGYVDMSTGMLLSVKTVDSHPQEVLDLVSAATADLFQGPNVSAIENLFRQSRGMKDDGHHYFQEILVNSDNLLHFFLRCKKNDDHVIVYVARKSANIGMMIAKARMTLEKLDGAL